MAEFLFFPNRFKIFKAFTQSQFKYCPLVWVFQVKQANYKIKDKLTTNYIKQLWELCIMILFRHLKIFQLRIRASQFTTERSRPEDLNDLRGRNSGEFFPRASRTNKLHSESELILPIINREKLYLLFWIGAVELKKRKWKIRKQ